MLPSLTDGFAGVTTMRSTGANCTVIDDEPVCPPAVAEIVALPGATPVTTPDDDTVATEVLLDDHVNVTPLITFPFAFRAVAVRFVVQATFTVAEDGETVTVATWLCATALTVTVAVAVFPSMVAVMTALPALTPVTSPEDDTVAMVVAPELQVVVRPVSAWPVELYGVAVSWTVWPTFTLGAAGVTTTLATGVGVTVTLAVPDFPSMVAVIVTVPAETAVTTPDEFTVARELLLVDQVATRR